MEEERDYYKEECLKLQEMLKKRAHVSGLYVVDRKTNSNRCCLCVGEPYF